MPSIRFRIRTIMITIAVAAALMGGVRIATTLLGISGVRIDGDSMTLRIQSERLSTANGPDGSLHIIYLRRDTQLPLKPLLPLVIGALALLSAVLWIRGRRRRHVSLRESDIRQ